MWVLTLHIKKLTTLQIIVKKIYKFIKIKKFIRNK